MQKGLKNKCLRISVCLKLLLSFYFAGSQESFCAESISKTPAIQPSMKVQVQIPVLPKRISGHVLDLGKVHVIYMVAGMATLIEIPAPVTGIRLGDPDSVSYYRPEHPKNEVTLVLKNAQAKPTNIIIRSGRKKYVFDIVPSKNIHQDTIEVLSSFGGAGVDSSDSKLIWSSQEE